MGDLSRVLGTMGFRMYGLMRRHVRTWYGEPCIYTWDCLRNNLLHVILRSQVQRRLGPANTMNLTTFTSTSYLRLVFTPKLDQDVFPWKSLSLRETLLSNQIRLLKFCSPKTGLQHPREHVGQQRSSRAQELPHHPRGLPRQTRSTSGGAASLTDLLARNLLCLD